MKKVKKKKVNGTMESKSNEMRGGERNLKNIEHEYFILK